MLDSLFEKIKAIYLWPTHQYVHCDGGCISTERDPVATVLSGTLVGAATLVVIVSMYGIGVGTHRALRWYRHRQRCCGCNRWTLERNSRDFPGCGKGQPCCAACAWEYINRFDPEITCGTPLCYNCLMTKRYNGSFTYHQCPKCGAVRLGKGVLNAILQPAYASGSHVGTERQAGIFAHAN